MTTAERTRTAHSNAKEVGSLRASIATIGDPPASAPEDVTPGTRATSCLPSKAPETTSVVTNTDGTLDVGSTDFTSNNESVFPGVDMSFGGSHVRYTLDSKASKDYEESLKHLISGYEASKIPESRVNQLRGDAGDSMSRIQMSDDMMQKYLAARQAWELERDQIIADAKPKDMEDVVRRLQHVTAVREAELAVLYGDTAVARGKEHAALENRAYLEAASKAIEDFDERQTYAENLLRKWKTSDEP